MADWSGFHRLDRVQRMRRVADHAGLSAADVAALEAPSGLSRDAAGAFIENAAGTFPVPLGFAVGFVIDGEDVVVPMAIEESSVVAAACHGAKMAAARGGFATSGGEPVTIGQVEIRGVDDPAAAAKAVTKAEAEWKRRLDDTMPRMVQRGGGVRAVVPRVVGGRLVVHLHVDTRDAMGANVVNTLCEAAAPDIAEAVGGRPGLRILSNLATERVVEARCKIPADVLGPDVPEAMVEAEAFAHEDPYRAATHNKGVMNGVDPVVLATGNDWRAIEAGVHAFAAREGRYDALTTYALGDDGGLHARVRLPVSVGTVGGITDLHPVARACLKVLGSPSSQRLAQIIAAVGLAQNLAALRALATEGIQAGHMRLHDANRELRHARTETKR